MPIVVNVKVQIHDDKRAEFDAKVRNAISRAYEINKDDMTFSSILFKSIYDELLPFCTPWITYCFNSSSIKISIIGVIPEYGKEDGLRGGLIIGDTI